MSTTNYIVAGAVLVCFATGAASSALYYRAEIAELKQNYAEAAERYTTALRQMETENAQKLAEAADAKQAEIDRLQSDLDGLRSEANRLRIASARSRAMPRSDASTCEPCQRQVSECLGLLGEGAELAEEGSRLLRDLNADREAVRKLNER